jgi:hypothetical protein
VVFWIAPAVLSFDMARKAPPVARVVPKNLDDLSISQALGTKLAYFGYEFEVPWTDLDQTQTKLSPAENPRKAVLTFRSGLRMAVTAIPPREWAKDLAAEMKVPQERVESTFGQSDYDFLKNLYEFTPAKMHYWDAYRTLSHEQFLLLVKSISLTKWADSGIFKIENQGFKGFQEGNPQARQDGISVHLLSDEGSVEFIFLQKDYGQPGGLMQPEINRIIQSLQRTQRGQSAERDSSSQELLPLPQSTNH